jgi:hypothetical protein
MRPKIVILTLLAAMGLVTLAAVLKGAFGRSANTPPVTADLGGPPKPASDGRALNDASSNNAALGGQLRAAEIDKELADISGAVVAGLSDPAARSLLLEKVAHPEPEVRHAALQAVVSINYTDAIPRLEEVEQMLENPREKVAVMDAISYLKLPDVMPDTPGTNDMAPMDFSRSPQNKVMPGDPGKKRNPKSRSARRQQKQGEPAMPPTQQDPQAAPPADPSQTQPATPAPDTAPPQ